MYFAKYWVPLRSELLRSGSITQYRTFQPRSRACSETFCTAQTTSTTRSSPKPESSRSARALPVTGPILPPANRLGLCHSSSQSRDSLSSASALKPSSLTRNRRSLDTTLGAKDTVTHSLVPDMLAATTAVVEHWITTVLPAPTAQQPFNVQTVMGHIQQTIHAARLPLGE